MLQTNNTKLIKRYFEEVWNHGQLDVLDEIIASNYVNHSPGLPNPVSGPAGLKPIVAAIRKAFPDLKYVIENMVVSDDQVAVQTTMHGTSLKSMSNDIVSLLDDLGIDHAHFMGHSLGASLLMQLCIEHPDKIKKAILCGGPATVPITAKWQVQGLQYAIERQLPDDYILLSVFPWLYGRRFLNDNNRVENLKARLMENPYPQTLAGFLAQTNVVLNFDISSHLKKIKKECLIVASDEDLLIPMHCLEFLKKNIIHSKLEVIGEGVGHMFHVEEPEQLTKLALNFFAGNHE